jgi:ribosome-binding protein aMBF1 (putative translation factor)
VNVNLYETQLHRARLPPLRVSLDIDHKDQIESSTGREEMTMVLVREAVGQTLRAARTSQGRTLRDVARDARVSLGYLSEVERGQKEASSELLNAICTALGLSLSGVFAQVASELKSREGVTLTVVDAA